MLVILPTMVMLAVCNPAALVSAYTVAVHAEYSSDIQRMLVIHCCRQLMAVRIVSCALRIGQIVLQYLWCTSWYSTHMLMLVVVVTAGSSHTGFQLKRCTTPPPAAMA